MSIFASRAQKTLEIPFDPPHTVTIQRLAGRHLAQAAMENQLNSIDTFRKMGGAAFQKELNAIRETEQAGDKPVAAPDPMAGYDQGVLIAHGVVAWSYEDPLTREALADLTDEASEFFAREVLRLSKPGLFLTAEESEAVTKNG
jgi:hypothetical protein